MRQPLAVRQIPFVHTFHLSDSTFRLVRTLALQCSSTPVPAYWRASVPASRRAMPCTAGRPEPPETRALPPQRMNLPLERPCVGIGVQPRAHGILPHVQPLPVILIPVTHLRIPKISLPPPRNGLRSTPIPRHWHWRASVPTSRTRQPHRHASFKIPPPLPHRNRRKPSRRTKQMHMIRHDHIPPHQPRIRIAACATKRRMKPLQRQKVPARLHGQRHEQDDRTVIALDRRRMRQMLALR